jgi:hypothetical protein
MLKDKKCSHCQLIKPLTEFHKNKSKKDGFADFCKKCYKELYSEDILKRAARYYKKYRQEALKRIKLRHKRSPWKRIFRMILFRCNNIKSLDYKYYGGRGIKCLITEDEIKELWFRDKAYKMKQPSIDRIDNDRSYTFENCQFLENSENAVKDKRIPILQYDLNGNFIKEWRSIIEAAKGLNVSVGNIGNHLCGNKNYTHAYGFIWKYK